MPEDRSLDEFVPDADPEHEDPDAGRSGMDDSKKGPISTTYVASDRGGDCANCGTVVEERWRHDDELVCRRCKEW